MTETEVFREAKELVEALRQKLGGSVDELATIAGTLERLEDDLFAQRTSLHALARTLGSIEARLEARACACSR